MVGRVSAPLPERLQQRVERNARRFGIPLHVLELIVQDAKVARQFLRAIHEGRAEAFLASLDETALERRLAERERGVRAPSAPGLRAFA